jgi:hypothetical protein
MTKKRIHPVVRAITDVMWKRDRLQMRAVDALARAVERRASRRRARSDERRKTGHGR